MYESLLVTGYMLSSNNDQPMDLRDSLAILEQSIKDFQAERKKLLRLRDKSKSNKKIDIFTSIIEAIENSLQRFSSNNYVLDLKDYLIPLFQEEKNKVIQSGSITETNLFDSTLQVVDEGLQQLETRCEGLRKKLEEAIKVSHEEALERAEKKWWKRRKQIREEQGS